MFGLKMALAKLWGSLKNNKILSYSIQRSTLDVVDLYELYQKNQPSLAVDMNGKIILLNL